MRKKREEGRREVIRGDEEEGRAQWRTGRRTSQLKSGNA